MWTVKIKTLNEDVVVAVLIAISTIANKPGFIWKKKNVLSQCVGLHSSTGRALQRYPSWVRIPVEVPNPNFFRGFIFLFLNCNYHCIYSFKIIIFIIIIIITIIYR